jgi:hypothetical protein
MGAGQSDTTGRREDVSGCLHDAREVAGAGPDAEPGDCGVCVRDARIAELESALRGVIGAWDARADVALEMATSAMRAWDEQLLKDDGSFGVAELRSAIRATLYAIAATANSRAPVFPARRSE